MNGSLEPGAGAMPGRAARRIAPALLACAGLAGAVHAATGGTGDAVPPAATVAPDAQRGRLLLMRYHCGSCHLIPGVASARGTLAMSLEGYGRRSYIAGRVANEPVMLANWIVAPASIVPGTLMPAMGVSPAEARDMAAYLGRLR